MEIEVDIWTYGFISLFGQICPKEFLCKSCQLREKVSFLAIKFREKAHVYVKTQGKNFR